MTTEFANQAWVACGNGLQAITDIHARHRARRAFDFFIRRASEGNHRAMKFLLESRREDTDNALMPIGIEGAQSCWKTALLQVQGFQYGQCLRLHVGFDVATFAIELIELACDVLRGLRILGQQTFYAQ